MQFRSVGAVFAELDRREAIALSEALGAATPLPVAAVLVEKRGVCELAEGTVITFAHPAAAPEDGVCPALLRSLRPFLMAAALGIPSGEEQGYLVSCPSKRGTTWRVAPVR